MHCSGSALHEHQVDPILRSVDLDRKTVSFPRLLPTKDCFQKEMSCNTCGVGSVTPMDWIFGGDPFQLLLSLPDDGSDRTQKSPGKNYVKDRKAMARTAVDVLDTPKNYLFVADMPGLKSADIQVQVENKDVLVISGQRKDDKPADEVKFLRVERRAGKFLRKFTLPSDASIDAIGAAYSDGVLTVTVPKIPPPEPDKPKTISIQVV